MRDQLKEFENFLQKNKISFVNSNDYGYVAKEDLIEAVLDEFKEFFKIERRNDNYAFNVSGFEFFVRYRGGGSKTQKPSKLIFDEVNSIFKEYLDTTDLNYTLLSTWVLGTYSHSQFETFPLFTVNARKQSGKTRTLKLSSALSCGSDGSISTSVTETFLFRHQTGAVFFDEQESIGSREKGALRETINACYKRGNKIIRYVEKKTSEGRTYVEEEFRPFYPIGLANIYGFNDVISDRAIQIILQRSGRKQSKLVEDFSTNPKILRLKKELSTLKIQYPQGIFTAWNSFVNGGKPQKGLEDIFKKIHDSGLSGRPLELFFPLFLISEKFGYFDLFLEKVMEYIAIQESDSLESVDDLLHEFVFKMNYTGFVPLTKILSDFRQTFEEPESWVNSKWLGKALKRLGFIKKKRHVDGKVQVILDTSNTTNSINTINTTNTTNTTNNIKEVELVDRVVLVGQKDHNQKPESLEYPIIETEKIPLTKSEEEEIWGD
jgi:hypothetical protein